MDKRYCYNGDINLICTYNTNKKILNGLELYNKNDKTILEIFENIFPEIDNKSTFNYFFICNNKLLNSYEKINNLICLELNNYLDNKLHIQIEAFNVIAGGDIWDDILDGILVVFNPIVRPIMGIGNVFVFLFQLLVWLGKFIYWFVLFVVWLFTDLLNPVKLIADFWGSIMLIVYTLFSTIMQIFMGIAAFIVNGVGGWMQGFFGWDQSNLTKRDKASPYFQKIDRSHGKKCYLTNDNTVPFSILLGTILCPPMGVFMDMGITGWLNIFVCAILTLLYYVPGLFYALLIIYS